MVSEAPQRVRELFTLSNEFIHDLMTGTNTFRTFQLPPFDELRASPIIDTGIFRLCLFHIILTLSKWAELYDKYNALIPMDVLPECRALKAEIKRRGIRDFRNKVVGHIWDKDKDRPFTIPEVDAWLERITAPGTEAFMRWVHDWDGTNPGSVVATVERLRDSVRAHYGLTDADLV